jgi:hypothetical protein
MADGFERLLLKVAKELCGLHWEGLTPPEKTLLRGLIDMEVMAITASGHIARYEDVYLQQKEEADESGSEEQRGQVHSGSVSG